MDCLTRTTDDSDNPVAPLPQFYIKQFTLNLSVSLCVCVIVLTRRHFACTVIRLTDFGAKNLNTKVTLPVLGALAEAFYFSCSVFCHSPTFHSNLPRSHKKKTNSVQMFPHYFEYCDINYIFKYGGIDLFRNILCMKLVQPPPPFWQLSEITC